ncbi:MAG: 50S ribosomal protein L18 [Candidatus Thiothrix putei]|jgi:large subunit ribosomal protein L18|uniref:Large ribosomal subunit protein uL18 n=4 Tax=Thiothrix TaxID=1030 RepID=A0A8B0SLK9_9GAMM|nr:MULTISPECIES: 50S ribosomal protein L18 [Thiothrix]WGZ93766.1 MAG: 50S ribosomal protein L18 [Candidatus Thiothrix putei]MBO0613180.1 50S ribosomal protein L18 [Thiothrix fructosivorans]QTR46200.1 50S ribosomal protein L18 [Thiothrix litoralis]QTX11380.1 50S ribosomal protein L18 [Thiothrix fructosivorans]WML89769.1 50S ribosomal protein L18 [Thiothrix lacustris]
MDKKTSRIRRGKRSRMKMRELRVNRLSIHRTSLHIYAQVVTSDGSQVLASASTLDKDLKAGLDYTGNVAAAIAVGKLVAERALAKGIDAVAFDRSGFKYHGRIKALADSAREAGLKF